MENTKEMNINLNENNMEENTIYFEDIDLLSEIEKLPIEHSYLSECPFYRVFPDNSFYKMKGNFPKTKEDLENNGYTNIRSDLPWKWIDELQCRQEGFRCRKKLGKYTIWFLFDTTRQCVFLQAASDDEIKKPEPKTYYWGELEEKIDEIYFLGEEKIDVNGLKYRNFNGYFAPEIKFKICEIWEAPQSKRDIQKLGCTSIDKDLWCYKQIGNKMLRLSFTRGNNYGQIHSIQEIEVKKEIKVEPIVEVKESKKRQTNNTGSSVYLLRNPLNNEYKIGKADNVEKRFKNFITGNPDIELITSKEFLNDTIALSIEHMLHKQFSHCRHGKSEWFALNDEEFDTVKRLLS